ncbi:MAG: hypothetical protein KDD83_14130, partial [Caldilineaceae bacterium]|nr:hypothetical protein [Caldilineaceae bacterium]
NVADPFTPRVVGAFNTPAPAYAVDTVGAVAYVGEAGGLRILDLTDPAAPSQLGHYDAGSDVVSVDVAGAIAYVGTAGFSGALQIVDVATPAAPVLLGQISGNNNGGLDVKAVGSVVYLAEGNTYFDPGFRIIDVSNPRAPRDIGDPGASWAPRRLAIAGQYAFLADTDVGFGRHGFAIVNVGTPDVLSEAARYQGIGALHRVFGAGATLFVAEERRVTAITVEDPARPDVLDQLDIATVQDGFAQGERLYLTVKDENFLDFADWQLRIIDMANPRDLGELGLFDNGEGGVDGGGVFVADGRVYMTVALSDYLDSALIMLDVADASSPEKLASVVIPDIAWRLQVRNNLVYVAGDGSGLHIYAVTSAPGLELRATVDTLGEVYDVALAGEAAFLADGTRGITVYDVGDPQAPAYVNRLAMPSTVTAVQILTDQAFVTDADSGLHVVDVGDPRSLVERANFDTPGQAQDLYVADDWTIYVADGEGGLFVLEYARATTNYLPIVRRRVPPTFPRISNGYFDLPADTSWDQSSSRGESLIYSEDDVSDTLGQEFRAHSSPNVAWLGGVADEESILRQRVWLPSDFADVRLSFVYRIGANEKDCGHDQAYVEIGSARLATFDLCQVNNKVDWQRYEINLAGFVGQTVDVTFRSTQDNTEISNWFLDSVILCDGTSLHPCE